MPRPLSNDLRERVVRAVEGGASRRQTAARFQVSVSFVVKLLQRWNEQQSIAPNKFGGGKTAGWVAHADRVCALVAENPDMTLDELRRDLAVADVHTSRSALGRCLLALGLTRKKDHAGGRTRTRRHRRSQGGMVRVADDGGAGAPGLSRRDLGFDQHGAGLWARAEGRAGRGHRAALDGLLAVIIP